MIGGIISLFFVLCVPAFCVIFSCMRVSGEISRLEKEHEAEAKILEEIWRKS
ncbi:MAG: hypothetical protein K6T51_01385 [Rubrobacteraceae bacterium]|nr:hypothetical protein [Rubrobacteraceae bacterium]